MIHSLGSINEFPGALNGLGRMPLHPKRPRKRDAGSEMTIMDKINRVALLGWRPIREQRFEFGARATQVAHHEERAAQNGMCQREGCGVIYLAGKDSAPLGKR
jgi:hypothetical protein